MSIKKTGLPKMSPEYSFTNRGIWKAIHFFRCSKILDKSFRSLHFVSKNDSWVVARGEVEAWRHRTWEGKSDFLACFASDKYFCFISNWNWCLSMLPWQFVHVAITTDIFPENGLCKNKEKKKVKTFAQLIKINKLSRLPSDCPCTIHGDRLILERQLNCSCSYAAWSLAENLMYFCIKHFAQESIKQSSLARQVWVKSLEWV